MAKRPTYLGAHSQEGRTVGFAGWGAPKRMKTRGPGLAGMAPAIDPAAKPGLLKRDQVPKKYIEESERRTAKLLKRAKKADTH